jgi:hypothetical protein
MKYILTGLIAACILTSFIIYSKGGWIINDIDNGLLFDFDSNDGSLTCRILFPIILKTLVDSQDFKNSSPKHVEKKNALEQLANSLNENDNPVLMLVKLKE